MDYPAYPVYRESGIEWLGKIPDHWELKKFRFLFSFGRGLGITKENLLDEGVPCINYGEIHSKYGFEVTPEKHPLKCVTPSYLETDTSSLLNAGDFVFADTSEDIEGSGNFSHLNSDVPTFAGYHTVIARPISNDVPRYMAYLFDSLPYRFQIRKTVSGVKVFSITQAILKNCYLWLPPKIEQQKVVAFLDHKTQQIDQLIAKKQTLIDKLNEQRIALITHAVTKGLNPDVTLKDSGVEWLGKVPEHWMKSRVKFFLSFIGSGKTPLGGAGVYIDDGIKLLRSQNIHDSGMRLDDVAFITDESDASQAGTRVRENDVLLNITGASIGRTSIVTKDVLPANVNQHVCILRTVNQHLLPEYLHTLLRSKVAKEQISENETGTSREGLNFSQIANLIFPIPPISEQKEIVAYLDKVTARIDRMVELNQQTIDKLKEYRTALITAAVTGKIDVRNWRQTETKGV